MNEEPTRTNLVAEGCTLECTADLAGVAADEPLYEVGPLRVALRMAGADPVWERFDRDQENYLSFPLPDGTCPVLEASAGGLRVGVPLGALAGPLDAVRVVVQASEARLALRVGDRTDEDFFSAPAVEADLSRPRVLSPRVRAAALAAPARPDALGRVPDARPIEGSVQYWTPADPDAWVGDVAPCFFGGRLHVFYLFDRRHHGSKWGKGGHFFAHLSTADLERWVEHPPAVPLTEWWTTHGTGTPFVREGRLCLAYGLHTDRAVKDGAFPSGGTWAESDDGLHFTKTGRRLTDAQNPSVYNRAGGGYELVSGYGDAAGLFRSDDLARWTLHDGALPFRGDCPSLFGWHGRRYLLQGFSHMAHSRDGAPGSFEDWSAEPDAAYDGLCVPMVVPWRGDRRLYVGWLLHPAGWGGWLVFRELVFHPDGRLGLKWVPEIAPPEPPLRFRAAAGAPVSLAFAREDAGAPALRFLVDPARRTAAFFDEGAARPFPPLHQAGNVEIGAVRGLDRPYAVRLLVHYDPKARATIFDAEIAGARTLICRRPGRYRLLAAAGRYEASPKRASRAESSARV